jgi:hypothetical protein
VDFDNSLQSTLETDTMGEARRRRAANAKAPCPCGSSKPAGMCCYDGREWHKPPVSLGLKDLPIKSVVEKCYMKELRSCDGGISGEHLISASIIRLWKADGDLSVSGLPWLRDGETKIVGSKNLTANCLCSKHNSALSPLDTSALYFFSALKSCLDREAGSMHYLVSGHDIERWLLKTIKAMAVSGNLARGQQRLSGAFASDIQVLDMLDDPRGWPQGAGIYCTMNEGEVTYNHNRFQLAPHMNAHDELNGLGINIMGLHFLLMLEPPNDALFLQRATFRPGQIMITSANAKNRIEISWEDGKRHMDTLSLESLRNVEVPQ